MALPSACLLPWQEWPLVSRDACLGSWVETRQLVRGGRLKEGRSVRPTEDGNRMQGRLPQMFCCRAGAEAGGLHLGKQREKRRSAGSPPGFFFFFFAGLACGLAEGAYQSWVLG